MPYPNSDRPSPPAGTVRTSVAGTKGGFPWANVFWIRLEPVVPPTQSSLDGLNDIVGQYYSSQFMNNLPDDVDMTLVESLYYGNLGGEVASSKAFSVSGSQGTDGLPNNCSIGISWRVQAYWRGGHPRTYLPPPDRLHLTDGVHFSSSYCDTIASAANLFMSGINGHGMPGPQTPHLGYVSFVWQKDWRHPPIFRDFIPGAAHVDQRLDTQRRRLGRDV